jgi:hypothetical protein
LTFSLQAALVAHTALPQTASLSGHILSEEGRPLHATVTLSFANPQGYPAPPRRTSTDTTGAFSFARLAPGTYTLCAQVSPSEPAPANSPFIDTCVWGSAQPPITLASGQQLTGVVFTAPKGAVLQVRVADPDHVLPPAAAKGPAPLEPELQLMLRGPDGLYRHARFLSSDTAGRNYQLPVPLKTALALKLTSTVANVFDQANNQIKEKDEVGFQPATPADLAPSTFTLHRKP